MGKTGWEQLLDPTEYIPQRFP